MIDPNQLSYDKNFNSLLCYDIKAKHIQFKLKGKIIFSISLSHSSESIVIVYKNKEGSH